MNYNDNIKIGFTKEKEKEDESNHHYRTTAAKEAWAGLTVQRRAGEALLAAPAGRPSSSRSKLHFYYY